MQQKCHKNCKCTIRKHEAVCSGRDLHYMPQFPDKIVSVIMSGTNLTYIDKNGFQNLTYIRLKDLTLNNNLVTFIHEYSFVNLKFLASLRIFQETHLDVNLIKVSVGKMKTTNLRSLYFQKNDWLFLPVDMFSSFSDSQIRTVQIKGNSFPKLQCATFSPLKKLQKLFLNKNEIEHIDLKGIPKDLVDLRLNENLLPKVPEWCTKDIRGVSLVNKLESLDLSDNNIGDIRIQAFLCLQNLKKLLLNRIPIKRIRSNIFVSMPVLYSVQLSKIGFPLKKIDDYAFNSSSLSSLRMDVANFHFDQEEFNAQTFFSLSPNLSFLNLNNNFFPKNETKMQQMFSPLIRLKKLIISSANLYILPKNVFPYLKSLETLTLSSNRLTDWNDGSEIFQNMTSLRNLSLKGNFIKIINKRTFPADILRSLTVLDLSFNPFVCTCDQLWFTEWIKTTKVKLLGYPTHYQCRAPPALDGTLFQKYVDSSKECPPWNPIYTMVIILLLSATVLALLFAIIMKCQTNIKNYLYLWRINYNRRKGYLPLQDADDFEYHAFVVYCDADRHWVHQKFLKKLEQDEGMKLCIHHRDFEIGESITANINNYLEKSWKVVVILSNEFAKSEWCQWEVDVVQERRRRHGRDVFLLIMLKNIDSKHMTNQLRALPDSASSLKYPNDVGEELFWTAAVETLRKPLEHSPTALL
ncbi:toll-like receptor 3 [Mytilus californianus]|uniref:toll-like receptor 3 n=1 Tax=Mytilus californianus TaxID=6549 RepID=UPI002245F1DA|nr:toll-like receptor 3 [Mytilus californianus]